MKEKNTNEEILSRRGFFKNAAKKVLPVIAIMGLNSIQTVFAEDHPTCCTYGGACSSSCSGGCEGCSGSCKGGCTNKCTGCGSGCASTCSGTATK